MQLDKKVVTKIIAIMLAVIAVFALVIPAAAAFDDYDISDNGSDRTDQKDSAQIVEEHLGTALSDAEEKFLKSYSTLVLKYNSIINANKVTLLYESGALKVTAHEYSYTADNGKVLNWIPHIAKTSEKEATFTKSGDSYVAILDTEGEADAEIVYKAEAVLSKQDFNSILNLYYYTAKYASDMSDYNQKLALYENYLYEKRIYDDALSEYNRYLEDYREYEEIKYKYEHYDELMARYEQDKAKYDAYLESLKTQAEDIKKYEEYEAKLAKVKKQLSAFELVYVKMKDKRDIYSAVMGGTVDQVLGSVGKIIAELGDDYENLVRSAEEATKALRGLMTEYRALETEEEKYNYYVANYTQMCDSVFDLTLALDKLYYAPGVRAGMKALEKHEKYVILVAQLVLTSHALIDGVVTDGSTTYTDSWTMDKRTYNQILENIQYFDDDDSSTPLDKGYPAPVNKPQIEEVENPTIPQRPESRPVAPDLVENPGEAPAEVKSPSYPVAQLSFAADVYSQLTSGERAKLAEDLSKGIIKKRNDISTSKTLNLQTIVSKKYNSETVKLTFEVPETPGNSEFKYDIVTDKSTPVVYDSEVPKDYTTTAGTFRFVGWKLKSDGSEKKLDEGFTESTILVPVYVKLPKYYNVTWVVDGENIVESHLADEIPSPGFVPTKSDDGNYCYEFVGWDKPVEKLTTDTVYKAKFDKVFIVPVKYGGATLVENGDNIICDASAFSNEKIDVSKLIPRIAGKYSLTIKTSIATLDFTFTEVVKMSELAVSGIKVDRISDRSAFTDSVFTLYNASGTEIGKGAVTGTLKVPHKLPDISNTVLKGDGEYAKFTCDGTYLTYRAKSGVSYRFIKEYSVVVVKSEFADISVSADTAYEDDTVKFTVTPKQGTEILAISVTDRNGDNVSYNPHRNTIRIKDRDVVISVTGKYILYNVAFVANGKIISEQQLPYGADPRLPLNPSLASDGEYKYVFTGWTPEVTPVTCDITYEANFDKIPVPVNENGTSAELPDSVVIYIKIAIIALIVLILGIIALVTFLIIRGVRKNRRIKARLQKKAQNQENAAETTAPDGAVSVPETLAESGKEKKRKEKTPKEKKNNSRKEKKPKEKKDKARKEKVKAEIASAPAAQASNKSGGTEGNE